jgi:predicted ferric reductase
MPDQTRGGIVMSEQSRTSLLRRILAPAVCAVTFAMAMIVWFDATGNPVAYFSSTVPPGQSLYVFSKLFALLGIVMLWFQAMATLARTAPVLSGFPVLTRRAHMFIGMATLALILSHLLLFIAASTVRTGHAAFNLLLPTFEHGYYRMMVGLGAISVWLLVFAILAGWRRLTGGKMAKWLHRIVFVAMSIGFVHGMTVGSETRFGLMKYVYAFMGLSLGSAVVSWCWHSVRRTRMAGATPPMIATGTGARGE